MVSSVNEKHPANAQCARFYLAPGGSLEASKPNCLGQAWTDDRQKPRSAASFDTESERKQGDSLIRNCGRHWASLFFHPTI